VTRSSRFRSQPSGNIADNASEVAILSYTMAGWQHGSKHAEVW